MVIILPLWGQTLKAYNISDYQRALSVVVFDTKEMDLIVYVGKE